MVSSLMPIIYIFLVFLVAYITIGNNKLALFDIILIGISILVLIYTTIKIQFYPEKNEHFEQNINNLKPIELEEQYTRIGKNLVVYNTAFNKNSYNNVGNTWFNVAATNADGTCDTKASNAMFNFELPPVYSRKNGFYMGNNRLIGPYSNAFKIQYHNTFTIVLACKHGNLLVDDTNNEIELFKFYANSPNNNGLSLYIKKGSLKNINNVQMGTLMFMYSNKPSMECKLKKED